MGSAVTRRLLAVGSARVEQEPRTTKTADVVSEVMTGAGVLDAMALGPSGWGRWAWELERSSS